MWNSGFVLTFLWGFKRILSASFRLFLLVDTRISLLHSHSWDHLLFVIVAALSHFLGPRHPQVQVAEPG